MYTVDEQLVVAVRDYFDCVFVIMSTIIVISAITPFFIVCLIPIVIFYAMQQQFFVVSPRMAFGAVVISRLTDPLS